MKKRTFKKEDNKRKNIKHGNLVNNEKVKEIQNKKKERKPWVMMMMMMMMNLDDEHKQQLKIEDSKRK